MVGFIFQDLCFRKGQFEPLLFMKVLLIKKSVYVAQSISVFESYVPIDRGGTVHLGGGMLAKNGRGRREATSNPCGMLEVDILSGGWEAVGGCDKMITRRRDVGEKQVWDVGDEEKNLWDEGFSYTGTCGRRHSTFRHKRSRNPKVYS